MSESRRIGPYRIEDRLGSGGMGEVWRAYDERLDRRVAIKLIRADTSGAAGAGQARERFRREARAAAALSHPSIVQIFDLIQDADGDAIVLELVEGETLSRSLARRVLSVREAVRLAREVAEGLAAAHARGIVHRDLKPENVMVTPGGHAKILDFGIAKRLEGSLDDPLTRENAAVGTFRSMSPEQARGQPVDHRSDLFSFGVLLYRMLTGREPFSGSSPVEVLDGICSVPHQPVCELRPEVPRDLSALVDQLLQKDPVLRPRSAAEVVRSLERLEGSAAGSIDSDEASTIADRVDLSSLPAPDERLSASYSLAPKRRWRLTAVTVVALAALAVVIAAIAGGLLASRPKETETAPRPAPPPLYVAVPRPQLAGGADDASAQALAVGLRAAILRGLLSFEGIRPLAPEEVDDVAGSPREIARALAAGEVLTSRLDCRGEVCRVELSRVAGRDGALLWSQGFSAALDQESVLPEAVQGYLRIAYRDRPRLVGGPALEARPEDYAEYLRLRQARDVRGVEVDELLERLAAIRSRSPRFLEAYAFEASVRYERFAVRHEPDDLERSLELLAEARRLAPYDPRPLYTEFGFALKLGRLDRAEEILRELDRLQPGDPRVLIRRARLLDSRGEPRLALALATEAVDRMPGWKNLFYAATIAVHAGDLDLARVEIQRLLRRAPGRFEGLSKLGEIELLAGNADRAAEIYAGLVERSPDVVQLSNLGIAQLYLKRYGEAESSYRHALSLAPDDPGVLLGLADALLLQGKRESGAFYRQTVERAPAGSPSLAVLAPRAQALAHLGRRQEAVAAVQEMLRRAPDGPDAAYYAALVYTLIGDRQSALFNAEKALAEGGRTSLFSLPWFDPLRDDPGFRRLLSGLSHPD